MSRPNRLVILLTDTERAAIDELAAREQLSTSTYARRALLLLAEGKGMDIPIARIQRQDNNYVKYPR